MKHIEQNSLPREGVHSTSSVVVDTITRHIAELNNGDKLGFTKSLQLAWPFRLDPITLVNIWQRGHEIIDPKGDVRGSYPPVAMPLAAVHISGRAMDESGDERWSGFAETQINTGKLPSWMNEDPAETYRLARVGVTEILNICVELTVPEGLEGQESPFQQTAHIVRDNMINGLLPLALRLDLLMDPNFVTTRD